MAALDAKGLASVREALSVEGFQALEAELIAPGDDIDCPDCGLLVSVRGLPIHRATNASCRWRQAAAEVRDLWGEGWRDPYNVEGAPLTWGGLTAKVGWRRRLCTVDFPRWTAVLLKP